MKKIFLSLVVGLASPCLADEPPDLNYIISRARENAKQSIANKISALTYTRSETTKDMDDNGNVKSTGQEIFKFYGQDGKLYKEILERNGQSVQEKPEETDDIITETFFDRYDFSWHTNITPDSNNNYLIDFKPKKKSPYANTDEDELFNKLIGYIIVDKNTFGLLFVQAHLPESYSKKWGLFKMIKFEIDISQINFDDIMAGNFTTIIVQYKKPFGNKYEMQTFFYRDYKYRNPS